MADANSAFAAMATADVLAATTGLGSVAVVCGAITTRGLVEYLSIAERDAHGFETNDPNPVRLTVPLGALGLLTRNVLITLDGVAHRLRTTDVTEDLACDVLYLRKEGA